MCEVRCLGSDGWRRVASEQETRHQVEELGLPAPVRPTLPALWDQNGVVGVPHLRYRRETEFVELEVSFSPDPPMVVPPFSVVSTGTPPI